MGTFTLDDPVLGKLGGGVYATIPFRMNGEFRDIQLRWYQNITSEDMEAHYLELFMSIAGVDETLPA